MTSRERWTIYPLLFLALGASLRSKVTSTIDVQQITTRHIEVLGDDGKPRLQLGVSRQDAGRLEVCDAAGNVVAVLAVDPKFSCGELELKASGGKAQVLLSSDGQGGTILTTSARGAAQVLIHSESDAGAVIAFDRDRATIVELSGRAGPSGVAVEHAQGPGEKRKAPSER